MSFHVGFESSGVKNVYMYTGKCIYTHIYLQAFISLGLLGMPVCWDRQLIRLSSVHGLRVRAYIFMVVLILEGPAWGLYRIVTGMVSPLIWSSLLYIHGYIYMNIHLCIVIYRADTVGRGTYSCMCKYTQVECTGVQDMCVCKYGRKVGSS